jgi:DNA-binding NtrC family response regulator
MMTDPVENLPGMIGRHPAMLVLYARTRRAAGATVPIFITGETGTGKELVARALHALADHRRGPFVPINCAAVPEGVAEAELFGVEPGAFTGAIRRRTGLLSRANHGTLFLDEVCSASPVIQAKLLRAVEHGEFERVGGERTERSDFRLVAASSSAPDDLIGSGALRGDLFHRLAMCRLYVPPLRDRPEDIGPLAQSFLTRARAWAAASMILDASALAALRAHPWPGNVRELQGVIYALAVFAEGDRLTARHVERELGSAREPPDERARLTTALSAHGWNASATARTLGVGRTKFYEWMRLYGIRRPSAAGPPA